MDTSTIMAGVILGAIGMGYIVYGRKQMHPVALICGIALCVFPYFVHNIFLMILIAAGVMAVPRFVNF